MPMYLGESLVRRAYLGSTQLSQLFVGGYPQLSDLSADFLNINPSSELITNWASPSSGDNRLISVSNGDDGRFYARAQAGELAVQGARRSANLLPDLNLATWSVTHSGADALNPVLTPSFGSDPVYGSYGRIFFDRGPTGGANYSWTYKRITTTSVRRSTCRPACWLRLNTGTSAIIALTRGLGTATVITVTDQWQFFSFDFSIPAGANADCGIGFYIQATLGSPQQVDLLIAMNDVYGAMVEVLSDATANHPFLSPNKSYSWGANGTKYYPQLPNTPLDLSLSGITFFDPFQRADTVDGNLGVAPSGSLPWSMRGPFTSPPPAQPPISLGKIVNHAYVCDPPATTGPPARAVYAYQHLRGKVTRLGAVIRYVTNTGANQGPNGFVWTLACGPQDPIVLTMLHFGGTHLSWFCELWLPDGTQPRILQGSFSPALTYGKSYYVEAVLDDSQITVTVPRARQSVKDPRLSQVRGPWCFWEHFINGPSVNLLQYLACYATEEGQSALPSGDYSAWQPRPIYPTLRPQPAATVNTLYTTDMSQAAWTKTGATVSAQTSAIQKLAEQQVFKLAEDTSTGAHSLSQATGLGAVKQTATVIVSPVERTRIRLRINNPTDGDLASAIFDITPSDAPHGSSGSVVSGTGVIDDRLRGGVFTLSVTGTATVTGSNVIIELVQSGTTVSYAGTAGSGVLVYYLGAEAGGYFTGPIVTSGTALSRSASQPSLGTISLPTSWTMLAEILVLATGVQDGEAVVGTNGAQVPIRLMADGRARADSGVAQLDTATGLITPGRHKIAVRRTGTAGAIFVDGAKRVDTAFDFALPASPVLSLSAKSDGSLAGTSEMIRFNLYKQAISDSALLSLTVP